MVVGHDNIFESNTAHRNTIGFSINAQSTGNIVRDNVANGNSHTGFEVVHPGTNNNTLTANRADNNGLYGFFGGEGASFNTMFRNRAANNGEFDAVDDGSGIENVWRANKFGTTSGI